MLQPIKLNIKSLSAVAGGIVLVGLVVVYALHGNALGRPEHIKPPSTLALKTKQCPRCFVVDHEVILDIPDLCVDRGVTLVIVIHVSADRFVSRETVRNTWLSEVRNKEKFQNVRYFFLLGNTDSESVRQDIQDESRLYKDIVQYNFDDTYRNLTIKTVLAMQWLHSRCPYSKFFFKTDDDVWVNVTNLLAVLQIHGDKLERALGGVCRSVTVVRKTSSKWHATFEEFPKDVYDPYCSGTGYVGGIAVAKGVVNVYTQVPYFYLEDVFMGMCLKLIGYGTKYLQHFDNTRGPEIDECDAKLGGYVTIHKITSQRMIDIYRRIC
ncbi:beta-1 3-galactosyltransferase 5 [Biomphalaria glabrata]|uniref:Hexosyltransferase n=1 Tax=Biomphalaria glabrata TaxID=6526 RepID=A0A9U8E1M0_BIOGL|nr:beta-1,3-galactosyltransferase 5-like [Biomphalaria glabrata]KAI8765248.1 beta-1; 3-galactosyltransferase 5-like [Biomphalaria glabrata]